jgi:hypothetical protein
MFQAEAGCGIAKITTLNKKEAVFNRHLIAVGRGSFCPSYLVNSAPSGDGHEGISKNRQAVFLLAFLLSGRLCLMFGEARSPVTFEVSKAPRGFYD